MPDSASIVQLSLPVRVLRGWGFDGWLWIATILAAGAAAWAHVTDAGQVTQFLTALVGVACTAAVMSRALDQVTGRLNPNAVGLFQAVTGNIPELVIGTFALLNHLDAVVLGTIAGSALNLLLFANAAAYIAGGFRYRVMHINTRLALPACVASVLMVTILVMPAVAVRLHTPAQDHQQAVSFTVAAVLLAVFVIGLPENLRTPAPANGTAKSEKTGTEKTGDTEEPEEAAAAWLAGLGTTPTAPVRPVNSQDASAGEAPAGRRWPLSRTLILLGIAGLLLAEEADWLTDPMAGALTHLHISQSFAGLFILAVVNNLSQVAPAVQFALRGDIDTAIAINLQGALQLVLMVAPVLMLIAPITGDHTFALIFAPLMAVAMVAATLLVVFVVLDGIANILEGVMLLGLYAVLASLFAWT